MNKIYKLHELIILAKTGKKFNAYNDKGKTSYMYFLGDTMYSTYEITCDWTVEEKREPRVIWVDELSDGTLSPLNKLQPQDCTQDNTIKFIEVLESDDSK